MLILLVGAFPTISRCLLALECCSLGVVFRSKIGLRAMVNS